MTPATSGVPPTLDSAQYTLWASRPDIAQKAVDAVVAKLGAIAPMADMIAVAVQGTVEAAATYDGKRGRNYAEWAFVYAAMRVWEWLRRAHGRDQETRARIRAAMFGFLAHDHRLIDPWASPEGNAQMLHGFSDGLLMAGHVVLRGEVLGGRGEQDFVDVEAARHAGDAVRKVLAGLTPEQRRLLQRCHAYGETVKKAANDEGKEYHTVLREYHELLSLMGARLHGLGIEEMPPWQADASGDVFEEPQTPANDDGRGR